MKEETISSEKTSLDLKSILLSGTKYAYIIGAVALLSGIFTPLTLGVEIEAVIFGMLSIFLGLAGGIVIFLGIKIPKIYNNDGLWWIRNDVCFFNSNL